MASNIIGSCLPTDMITEILSMLPPKSLLRFKSVCRNWLALITSSHFISFHSQFRPKQSVFFTCLKEGQSRVSCCITSILPDGTSCRLGRDAGDGDGDMPSFIIHDLVGSSNGLICLLARSVYSTEEDYVLWNPATRQYRHLPASPLLARFSEKNGRHAFRIQVAGFGFHHGINDYKLFRIVQTPNATHAEVFTLSAGSWREVDEAPIERAGECYFGHPIGPGVVVKGVWYHVGFEYSLHREFDDDREETHEFDTEPKKNTWLILSFDMGNDTLSETVGAGQLPYQYFDPDITRKLMVYKDSLAMSIYRKKESCHEIWTLKSTDETWTRLFIIPNIETVLGFWNDKEIIIRRGYNPNVSLVLLDPFTKRLRMLPQNDDVIYFRHAHTYVESLASIF
ncbi:unnamed protein product [Dovyalis caffra]|uniref:F-box domain-containing protein n=1 Tax=Dovyalis caffra TaxID=77055 RepID=A0AAV1QW11_9ROSI|nr:unnamed protein product [Dovyalis caffra]